MRIRKIYCTIRYRALHLEHNKLHVCTEEEENLPIVVTYLDETAATQTRTKNKAVKTFTHQYTAIYNQQPAW